MTTTTIDFGGHWGLVGIKNADGSWTLRAQHTTLPEARYTLRALQREAARLLAAELAG